MPLYTTCFEPARFESCLSAFTAISGCLQPGQAKVVLGPTPLDIASLALPNRPSSFLSAGNLPRAVDLPLPC
jgi:hypothetical protein